MTAERPTVVSTSRQLEDGRWKLTVAVPGGQSAVAVYAQEPDAGDIAALTAVLFRREPEPEPVAPAVEDEVAPAVSEYDPDPRDGVPA